NITVNGVNDPPVNTLPGPQTTNEDTVLVLSSGGANAISIGDIDAGAGIVKVTLSATNGVMTLAATTGLTFTTGDGTADAMMVFTGTMVDINAALDGMSFTPSANYNGPASIAFTTNDQGNTGSGGALSDTDTLAITVDPVNDAPTVTASGTPLAYTENDGPRVIDSGLVVDDVDNATLAGAVIQFASGYHAGEDVLAFTDQSGITGSWDSLSGTLTLTGSATLAQYQTAL